MFIFFLITFLLVTIGSVSTNTSFEVEAVDKWFKKQNPSSISSRDDFWRFMTDTFPTAVLSESVDSGPFLPITPSNFLLGGISLRQSRVMMEDCALGIFSKWGLQCWPGFSSRTESRGAFVRAPPTSSPPEISGFFFVSGKSPVSGKLANYPGSGYNLEISSDPISLKSEYLSVVRALEQGGWVDLATRGFFLEFVVANANTGNYIPVRLGFEWSPIGVSCGWVKANVLGAVGLGVWCGRAILVIIGLSWLAKAVHYGMAKKTWNFLEILVSILVITATILRIFVFIGFRKNMEISSLWGWASLLESAEILESLTAFFLCFLAKKIHVINKLTEKRLIGWLTYMTVLSICFGIAISGFFCDTISSSFYGSILFLARMMVGNAPETVELLEKFPGSATVVIALWIVAVCYIGGSLLLSIFWMGFSEKNEEKSDARGIFISMMRSLNIERRLKRVSPFLHNLLFSRFSGNLSAAYATDPSRRKWGTGVNVIDGEIPEKKNLMKSVEKLAGRSLGKINQLQEAISSCMQESEMTLRGMAATADSLCLQLKSE